MDAGAVALAYIPWSSDDYEPRYEVLTQEAVTGGVEVSEAGDRFGASPAHRTGSLRHNAA